MTILRISQAAVSSKQRQFDGKPTIWDEGLDDGGVGISTLLWNQTANRTAVRCGAVRFASIFVVYGVVRGSIQWQLADMRGLFLKLHLLSNVQQVKLSCIISRAP